MLPLGMRVWKGISRAIKPAQPSSLSTTTTCKGARIPAPPAASSRDTEQIRTAHNAAASPAYRHRNATRPERLRAFNDGDDGNGSDAKPKRHYVARHSKNHFQAYLKTSPTKSLGTQIRVQSGSIPPTSKDLEEIEHISRATSLRLPVMLAHMLLRQARARGGPLAAVLPEPTSAQWFESISILSNNGITRTDFTMWMWILTARRDDDKIERFLSATGAYRPIFLLLLLLGKRTTFQKVENLVGLLNYVVGHYIRPAAPPRSDRQQRVARRALLSRFNMNPVHFNILIYRLVRHCVRLWPPALISIAHLVVQYMADLPTRLGSGRRGYMNRCLIFNNAISCLGTSAPIHSLGNRKYNWEAQRVLLAYSTSLHRHLRLNRQAYRVVRGVMLGLRKTKLEQSVALRAAHTWPPFPEIWDGIDEQLTKQDTLSRSAKAGLLMREEGYASEAYDQATGTLGGSVVAKQPTIQTRSLPPYLWEKARASSNIFSLWAARVKATRNPSEAWRLFQEPPLQPTLKPNIQVYAEMFDKLLAGTVKSWAWAPQLPGDVKEAFVFDDVNQSAWETAKWQPPSVIELYERMIGQGIRPVGRLLATLIRNSPSCGEALHFLDDSPHKIVVPILRRSSNLLIFSWDQDPAIQVLKYLPSRIFNAWVHLMCRHHSNDRASLIPELQGRDGLLRRAIKLTGLVHGARVWASRVDKRPWHSIMKELAGRKVLFNPHHYRLDYFETMYTFVKVYGRTVKMTGLDVDSFEQLSVMFRRALARTRLRSRDYTAFIDPHTEEFIIGTHALLADHFDELVILPSRDFSVPQRPLLPDAAGRVKQPELIYPATLLHEVNPLLLHRYMRALACIGDVVGMNRVMDWVLRAWDLGPWVLYDARRPGEAQHAHMNHLVIQYFANAAARLLVMSGAISEVGALLDDGDDNDGAVPAPSAAHEALAEFRALRRRLARLNAERGCPWLWPDEAALRAGDGGGRDLQSDMATAYYWAKCGDRTRQQSRSRPAHGAPRVPRAAEIFAASLPGLRRPSAALAVAAAADAAVWHAGAADSWLRKHGVPRMSQ